MFVEKMVQCNMDILQRQDFILFFFKDVLLVILPKSVGVSLLSPSEGSY